MQKFTNFACLDIFMRQSVIKNSDHQHRLQLLKKVQKEYKNLEIKNTQEVFGLTTQLEHCQGNLKQLETDNRQLTDKLVQLGKKLAL